jgi:hypothetical protein
MWEAFEKKVRGMPSEDDLEKWIRAPDNALRLATVSAVYRGSPVVEIEDVEWGVAVAKHSTEQLAWGLNKYQQEELTQAELVDHIRNAFISRAVVGDEEERWRVMTDGEIKAVCEKFTNDLRVIAPVIKHMIDVGDLELTDKRDWLSAAGRPNEILSLAPLQELETQTMRVFNFRRGYSGGDQGDIVPSGSVQESTVSKHVSKTLPLSKYKIIFSFISSLISRWAMRLGLRRFFNWP